MCKWLLSICCFLVVHTMTGQDKTLPAEAARFLLPGFQMLDYVAGDINNDQRPDAILVMKQNTEDSSFDKLLRPLVILIRGANGKLEQVVKNDSAILCRHCGGVFGDPYEGIEINKSGFKISFYGGSSWRWGYTYWFRYNAANKKWMLNKETSFSYHSTEDPEETMKETTIDAPELEGVSIINFNCNPNTVEIKWKVVAAKTFFYTNPRVGTTPRRAYLVKGDTLTSYRILKNFVQVYFQNSKAQSTSGFILKKDIIKAE